MFFITHFQISVKILKRKVSREGEIYQEMKSIKVELSKSCIFFVWPLDIVHIIDEDSPFYDMTAADLAKERFELLVVMEGTNETSNMAFQARYNFLIFDRYLWNHIAFRTSYLPNEILWGHRFESALLYRKDHNKFQVNFSAFHSTYEVDTPVCSARTLNRFQATKIKRQMSTVSYKSSDFVLLITFLLSGKTKTC